MPQKKRRTSGRSGQGAAKYRFYARFVLVSHVNKVDGVSEA
jgi:hypothetical protein